jgi:hypothetical protein
VAPDRLELRPAVEADAAELAETMRAADAAEVLASGGYRPLEAALVSLAWTRRHGGEAYAARIDGQVVALFGVARPSLLSTRAFPWLLTGEGVNRHPIILWRESQAVVADWLERFGELEQQVDARYVQALRWARRLGFEVAEPAPFGQDGRPFCKITLRRT